MSKDEKPSIFIGKSDKKVSLALKYANRHGLVAGATGTGKTVSLQIMAEEFSNQGVPVFIADVKGDIAGMAKAGEMKDFLAARAEKIDFDDYDMGGFPVTFWDLHGQQGHPLRTTVSEMGPLLLSRLLNLNDTQEGVLTLAFKLADDEQMLLLDLKDLRALMVNIAERRKELSAEYGNVSTASVGAIQRKLLQLEAQGAKKFFGEPALDLRDFMRVTEEGRGIINILAADKLMMTPKLYATFLLWLLSELFEELPEIGDPDKPVFVFFFDEAHLLFKDAPDALMDKIEQVVRLIRSKGVGIYFVSQNPLDVPDSVSSQLGNRVQHALRAFTPKEQKVIRAAADTFRPNPKFKTRNVITQLGIGEALVSTLLKKGIPGVVEQTLIRPPSSRMGPLTKKERKEILDRSLMGSKYDKRIDRKSAYEILTLRAETRAEAAEKAERKAEAEKEKLKRAKERERAKKSKTKPRRTTRKRRRSNRQSVGEAAAKTAVRTFTRAIVRGILGSFKR
jgi:DNA double-strand break repair helicase HerA and related ATPase